jgi:UDP-glucose 4-epimerase
LVTSSEGAKRELGWRPCFADLDEIARTALVWREAHPNSYGD